MEGMYQKLEVTRVVYLLACVAIIVIVTMGSLCSPPVIGWQEVEREDALGDIKIVLEPIYDMSEMPWYAQFGIKQDGGFLLAMLGFLLFLLGVIPAKWWGVEEEPRIAERKWPFREHLKQNWKLCLGFGIPPAIILSYLVLSNTWRWGDEPIWIILLVGYPVFVFAWLWAIALVAMVIYAPVMLKDWLVGFLQRK